MGKYNLCQGNREEGCNRYISLQHGLNRFQTEAEKLLLKPQAIQHKKSIGNQSYKAVKYMGHSPKGIGFLTRQ